MFLVIEAAGWPGTDFFLDWFMAFFPLPLKFRGKPTAAKDSQQTRSPCIRGRSLPACTDNHSSHRRPSTHATHCRIRRFPGSPFRRCIRDTIFCPYRSSYPSVSGIRISHASCPAHVFFASHTKSMEQVRVGCQGTVSKRTKSPTIHPHGGRHVPP